MHPLELHLQELEQAVCNWLEANQYNNALPDVQRAMRKKALLPAVMDAEMPEAYRLWRLCQDSSSLWWDGGISNQPHILTLEFSVCAYSHRQTQEYLANTQRILNDGSQHKS